jgi:hypothetical protein
MFKGFKYVQVVSNYADRVRKKYSMRSYNVGQIKKIITKLTL